MKNNTMLEKMFNSKVFIIFFIYNNVYMKVMFGMKITVNDYNANMERRKEIKYFYFYCKHI